MSTLLEPLIFDGHNDVLTRLWRKRDAVVGVGVEHAFLDGDGQGHLDLPRMCAGGFGGGFFAIWIPPHESGGDYQDAMRAPAYDIPLPPMMSVADALPVMLGQAAILHRIEAASEGAVRICHHASEVQESLQQGQLAAVLHLEGAEPIDNDFHALHVMHAAGLRSLGPVWSRPTRFGHGVPFRFPSDPNTGAGLTPLGEALVCQCNKLKIMLDLSHLNEAGFRDVMRLSDAPLVATHSNAHALCPSARNLTDWQLEAIAETGGVVGLNFATCFLREDGQMNVDTPLDTMLRHLDHLLSHLGEAGVALGSDFDGAEIPQAIGDVAGLPNLREALAAADLDAPLMQKLCHGNWVSLLQRTLSE